MPGHRASGTAKLALMLAAAQASQFAKLALACLRRELPHKVDHLWTHPGAIASPRELHPAFYGCLDWHSAVHGHWMLARLLRRFPKLPEAAEIRELFDETLTIPNVMREAEYFTDRVAFERTYGWAWLLALACELPDPWSENLDPLVQVIVLRYLEFLPKQTYPIRTGVHANTAFGLSLALDYARTVGNGELEQLITDRALAYYGGDVAVPAAWEPSGEDFFSPALLEADLMRRVVGDFPTWFGRFMPALPPNLRSPVAVRDRSDPKLAHLDGLNLSRAWCLRALGLDAEPHLAAGLAHVATGDYAGEHWLATFAVLAVLGE